ncbi:MAG: Hg(II)-responsive transcriptional regulator [Burkholderiaceae bacterium]|nr:Hg(II)-responsive transcriptional regulator [Burkholderiaceae bacterium]
MDQRATSKAASALPIGALAELAGVGVETIRYYQRRGLLSEPARAYGSIRRYGAADMARVSFIKRAQQLGFSLDEVAELLRLDDGAHCDDARALAEIKLADVRRKLDDLRRIEDVLAALVQRCCATRGDVTCPLIAGLQSPQGRAADADGLVEASAGLRVRRSVATRRRKT